MMNNLRPVDARNVRNLIRAKFGTMLRELLEDLRSLSSYAGCGLECCYLRLKLFYSGIIIRRLESKLLKLQSLRGVGWKTSDHLVDYLGPHSRKPSLPNASGQPHPSKT